MKREITYICATALILMLCYMVQNRYEFINDKADLVSVGDRWTGCVDYSEISGDDVEMFRSEC